MAESAEERSRNGQEGRHKNALFYAEDGMVTLLDPRCIQGSFSTLIGLFDRVGLKVMSGRQSEWYAARVRRRGRIWTRCTG